jgi:hypothetical protein
MTRCRRRSVAGGIVTSEPFSPIAKLDYRGVRGDQICVEA